MGWCSMAMNRVFSTMQMVMVKSVNGSITMSSTTFLIFNHSGQQSQIRNMWAKVYQHGGHFFLDSSSSGGKRINPNVVSNYSDSVLVPCHGVRYLPSTVLVMTLAMLRTRCRASGPSRKSLKSCCAPPPLGCLYSVSVVSAWRRSAPWECCWQWGHRCLWYAMTMFFMMRRQKWNKNVKHNSNALGLVKQLSSEGINEV